MKTLSATLVALLTYPTLLFAQASPSDKITETYHYSMDPAHIYESQRLIAVNTIVGSKIAAVEHVTVDLHIAGDVSALNGDYVANLFHGTNFASLLNRVGKQQSMPYGYPDNGLNITLDDDAPNGDIHAYRKTLFGDDSKPIDVMYETLLTGTWAPDGRITTFATKTSDPRLNMLSVFNGSKPNGNWVLTVDDMDVGGVGVLVSWSITITGQAAAPKPLPQLSISREQTDGVEFLRFSVTGSEPNSSYTLQTTSDFKTWVNEFPNVSLATKGTEFTFRIPASLLGSNKILRLVKL